MQSQSEKRRILIIDDNDSIHSDFRKILANTSNTSALAEEAAFLFGEEAAPSVSKPQFEVDSALQGQEGLAKLEAALAEDRPYSVAFVDMRMPPGWDGLQTIQKLWEVDPSLQVVICSAYSDYTWDEISAKLGLTDRLLLLKKPFDPAEAAQLATALSEKWSLRREARMKMEELEAIVKHRTKELTHIALHDKLTGLANRVQFNDVLAQAVARAKQESAYKFALLFLDFDRFELINDSLGHNAGDHLLKCIADRLTGSLALAGKTVGNALAARLGGDEFVILIDGIADVAQAGAFADGLLRTLGTPYRVEGRDVHSTASIGITCSDLHYQCAEDALRDADTAMYHAKAAGKARYVIFDRAMHDQVTTHMEMENELRGAMERGELRMYYQPIVSISTGIIEGFEALIRWQHPKRGMVSPQEFIPICEEIGMIIPVGFWALNEACRQLRVWKQRFPDLPHLTMSVNISGAQLAAPELVEQIAKIIRNNDINPASLALEITESVMIKDINASIEILHQIRRLGVKLHMDDFGSGYSALSCLHRFPLNGMKIDHGFVKNVSEHRDYAAVVHAIVGLAQNLGIRLIAEGIETADQLVMLQALECELAQGYYFSQPQDAQGAEAYMKKQFAAMAMA